MLGRNSDTSAWIISIQFVWTFVTVSALIENIAAVSSVMSTACNNLQPLLPVVEESAWRV